MNVPLLMCFRASRAATSNVPSEFGVNDDAKVIERMQSHLDT